MTYIATGLVILVALLHVYFLVLEMFLWQRPYGRRTFAMTSEQAEATAVLAGNQGLYNGFLAAGLFLFLAVGGPEEARLPLLFLLACVVVAGIYGGFTASRRILLAQALPGALALIAVALA